MMDTDSFRIEFLSTLNEVERRSWNSLAGESSPFLKHEFLLALESSGCTTRATGWEPHHIAVYDPDGKLLAAMPLYRKSHSYGEYVFDWSWADAYRTAGLQYYPKFVSSIPFTPSIGPRLLTGAASGSEQLISSIVAAVTAQAADEGASSWHILFPPDEQAAAFQAQGLLQRAGCQFHWHNKGYLEFDDFLAVLSSRKRKNIRKERQAVRDAGIVFEQIEGRDITEQQWRAFHEFYQTTYRIRGMEGYLNPQFFIQVNRAMPDNLLLVFARKDGEIIAGAMFFKDNRKLYGRYWGCLEEYQFLHFETCFYQGIDYCITSGLEVFDAGAQGEHKIQRGFEPQLTHSCHWIADARFRPAIEEFLDREQRYIEQYREEAKKYLPFRKDNPA